MKKTLTAIMAVASAISLSQAAEYTQKYDSTFGASIKGAYAWATEDGYPNIAGGLLSIHNYVESGSLIHQFSINSGILAGNKTNGAPTVASLVGVAPQTLSNYMNANGITNVTAKVEHTSVPLLFGYELNVPVSDSVMIYGGGKLGVTFNWLTTKTGVSTVDRGFYDDKASDSSTDFTGGISAGIKVALSDTTDLVIGYELLKINHIKPYHVVELGVSWNF